MNTPTQTDEEGSPRSVESGQAVQGQDARAAGWLMGGGEMGERIRSFDWSKTPIGPIESWSPALRTIAAHHARQSVPAHPLVGASVHPVL